MRFHLNIADLITLSQAEESFQLSQCFWETGAPLQREKTVSNPNLSTVHLRYNFLHISMVARCLQTRIGAFDLKKGLQRRWFKKKIDYLPHVSWGYLLLELSFVCLDQILHHINIHKIDFFCVRNKDLVRVTS